MLNSQAELDLLIRKFEEKRGKLHFQKLELLNIYDLRDLNMKKKGFIDIFSDIEDDIERFISISRNLIKYTKSLENENKFIKGHSTNSLNYVLTEQSRRNLRLDTDTYSLNSPLYSERNNLFSSANSNKSFLQGINLTKKPLSNDVIYTESNKTPVDAPLNLNYNYEEYLNQQNKNQTFQNNNTTPKESENKIKEEKNQSNSLKATPNKSEENEKKTDKQLEQKRANYLRGLSKKGTVPLSMVKDPEFLKQNFKEYENQEEDEEDQEKKEEDLIMIMRTQKKLFLIVI